MSESVRDFKESQKDLADLQAPLNPPRPALVVLLMSMVNAKPGFEIGFVITSRTVLKYDSTIV